MARLSSQQACRLQLPCVRNQERENSIHTKVHVQPSLRQPTKKRSGVEVGKCERIAEHCAAEKRL